jgi:hypothetical protein
MPRRLPTATEYLAVLSRSAVEEYSTAFADSRRRCNFSERCASVGGLLRLYRLLLRQADPSFVRRFSHNHANTGFLTGPAAPPAITIAGFPKWR